MCTLRYDNGELQKHPPVAKTLPTLPLQQLPELNTPVFKCRAGVFEVDFFLTEYLEYTELL